MTSREDLAAILSEVHGQTRGRPETGDRPHASDARLLNDLESSPAADEQDPVVHGHAVLEAAVVPGHVGHDQHQRVDEAPVGLKRLHQSLQDNFYESLGSMIATEVFSFVRDPQVSVQACGDVARLSDGTTQVVWSTLGEIQNITEDGSVVWTLNADLGLGITYVQVIEEWGPW